MFGLPYIIAPMEAEAQCAWLNKEGLVDGVVTDDNDAFLFGAKEASISRSGRICSSLAIPPVALHCRLQGRAKVLLGLEAPPPRFGAGLPQHL